MDFNSSGAPIPGRRCKALGGTCVFACKGCMEVARLVGEVEYLRQMMESMKRIVTGQGLEDN